MKKWFSILCVLFIHVTAFARHVAGGELFYEYLGPGSTVNGIASSSYRITLRLFRDCTSSGPRLDAEEVTVGIYNGDVLINSLALPLSKPISTISLNTGIFPCLAGNVSVCYEIGIYSATITLPDNAAGYTLSRSGCCRVDGISNLSIKTSVGSNYVTRIPGTRTLTSGHNSSPVFFVKDTALVCANKLFKLDFGASDADKDSLSFSFCEAYTSTGPGNNSPPTTALTLITLPYQFPYSGSAPLGAAVTIDPVTGIISGTAPPQGSYVVNVCITEWRNGRAFTQHRKDFILKVQNCDIIEADLPDKLLQCTDFTVHFENQSTSSSITSYLWNFGNGKSSSSPVIDYTYADTGTYKATLTVTGPKGCVGRDTMQVMVYPGFKPGFSAVGSCFQNPFRFTDTTQSKYGTVNSWRWDLGDESTLADTAITPVTQYRYSFPSTKKIKLVVTNTKGCIDSLQKNLLVSDKPVLQLPFKDTLICSIDSLMIPVPNPGNYSWTPAIDILYANTSSPVVFPKTTMQYFVAVDDNGCKSNDTITVHVLDHITVDAGKDSLLCRTDTIRLNAVSQGLGFNWTSSSGEIVSAVKQPLIRPLTDTRYIVLANLGKCLASDTVFMRVVPYPTAIAGSDTGICFGSKAFLHAVIKGTVMQWSPAATLSASDIVNPVAVPSRTTTYTLKVFDTLGCPKPGIDSITVIVTPPVPANAGRDTAVLVNQPLQLQATGGEIYSWSPETGLSNTSISNPIVTLDDRFDSVIYKVRVYGDNGCYADDEIRVRVFKSGPDIFVPSAFTPNADGKNDILRPVTVGIATLKYFSIYDRWGQLIFTTAELGKGWDGTYHQQKQPANTYVFIAEGLDINGKTIFRKGTTVLIR